MHICVIDNYINKTLTINFSNIFAQINKNIKITTYDSADKELLRKIHRGSFDAIILTGSERRVHRNPVLPVELLNLNIPVLGICYGFQWMTFVMGGALATFENNKPKDYNKFLTISQPFAIPRRLYKFYHNDYITMVPKYFTHSIIMDNNIIVLAYDKNKKHMGIQCHPEKHKSSAIDFFTNWLLWLQKNNINAKYK